MRFEPVPRDTRVTVEHRGWDRVNSEILAKKLNTKRWGWANVLNWYNDHVFGLAVRPLLVAAEGERQAG